VFEYLRRLATTGAAYTASSVLSKLIAVFLLPVYTAYLSPSDYGAAEVMLASVVAASIVVRFGVIEAILRFYYVAEEDRRAVVATGFAALFWASTAGALVALALAAPISEVLIEREDAGLARLAILGLWTLTMWEFVLTLLRLDERARLYFGLTVINVAVTIPVTVYLVVEADLGADAILLGTFGTGVFFLLWRLWQERRRLSFLPDRGLLRRMVRFGLPTMPAELTLYSLNFIDRILLVRLAGLAEAGLYALAIKFANAMQVLSRGFQLAFPPLAYSIADDDEARRAYSLLFTWFAAVCAFAVAGLWLLSRSLVDVFATAEFSEAHEAIGLLATGVALYALYLALVVILGRTGRTEFNFPATAAGTAANIVLNLILIPPLGIVGAGFALVGSYLIVLALMYALTQRLFPVPYEWGRLARLVMVTAATIAVGELALPTDGFAAIVTRGALWLALPALLWASGFLTAEERRRLREMLRPEAVRRRLQTLRSAPVPSEPVEVEARSSGTEVYEQAQRDEDRGGV
jgi:O-antigen/teichoic acid export membrane protein